jgi:hypothetical protein
MTNTSYDTTINYVCIKFGLPTVHIVYIVSTTVLANACHGIILVHMIHVSYMYILHCKF